VVSLLVDVLGLVLPPPLLLLLLQLLRLQVLRCSYAAESAGCCTGASRIPALPGLAELQLPTSRFKVCSSIASCWCLLPASGGFRQ
jgi:hypothetical protein